MGDFGFDFRRQSAIREPELHERNASTRGLDLHAFDER